MFKQYYRPLCFFADKILQDKVAAEDTVENVFIKLWEKNPDFNSYKNLKAALYISVKNACLNQIRQRRKDRSKKEALSYVLERESEDFILNEIVRAELLDEVYKELRKLPPECRKVMQLHFLVGQDYKTIAADLGITVSTVKNHKAYGTKILKRRFGRNFMLLLSYSVSLAVLQN
ncbi:MAG TPA: RNA polymerase sigma-70 factor [Puia sp.]|nr:RNA polymerase sigma-70 factor [Puia sp.]